MAKLIAIAMLSSVIDRGRTYQAGRTYDVDADKARQWKDAGYAADPDSLESAARDPVADLVPQVGALTDEQLALLMLQIATIAQGRGIGPEDLTGPGTFEPLPEQDAAGGASQEAPGRDPDAGGDAGREPSRIVRLRDAIGQLDPENGDHFTKSGKPQVDALEAITGLPDVSGVERDAAWLEHRQGIGQ